MLLYIEEFIGTLKELMMLLVMLSFLFLLAIHHAIIEPGYVLVNNTNQPLHIFVIEDGDGKGSTIILEPGRTVEEHGRRSYICFQVYDAERTEKLREYSYGILALNRTIELGSKERPCREQR